jgi:hypothetical protein
MPETNISEQLLQFSRNLFFVLRGVWVLLIFNCLAIIAFLFLPQGTDVLLLLLENSFQVGNPSALFFLTMGVCFWSISSEFCARMLLYMTDNSGHSLSVASVKSRKNMQVGLAKSCLYIPPLILSIGFIKAYFQNQSDNHFPLGVLLLLLLVLIAECWLFFQMYHAKIKFKVFRNWMRLSAKEAYWTGKLYGIFNQFRIDLPLNSPFSGLTVSQYSLKQDGDLPRESVLANGAFIPVGFVLIEQELHHQPHPFQTWIYRIPLNFYSGLLKQFFLLCGISFLLILAFVLIPLKVYSYIGATTIVCCGFGCWQLCYTFLNFLDRAQPLAGFKIPYRCLVLFWLLFCSYANKDHPIRSLNVERTGNSPTILMHFESWAKQVEMESKEDSIPIYLVSAEGGALRTGAFTAMVLSKLADLDSNFSKRVYAYSTVSGGSLGAGFFQSIQGLKSQSPNQQMSAISKRFFETDFLSAVTGKLVFAEILQCFIPWHVPKLDRAIALEASWEAGWANAISDKRNSNHFELPIPVSDKSPAILFQTVEAETGLPCIWSNLNLQGAIPFSATADLQMRYHKTIALSTAINLSARFPLLSPAAMMEDENGFTKIRRHYVDGGYFENSGQETLFQLIHNLPIEKHPRLIPKLLCFNFSELDSSMNRGIYWFNEIAEIVVGIYQTRNARTSHSQQRLNQYCIKRFGQGHLLQLELGINIKKMPMNWVLSHTAMQRMEAYSNDLIKQIIPFISSTK